MTFLVKYKPLVQVNILHQYFLNKGTVKYANMSKAEKEKQLIGYDVSNFLTLQPTAKTRQKLNGHKMVSKIFKSGFTVWTRISESDDSLPFIAIDDSLELTFLLKLNTSTFFNFSDFEFETADKLFFFSNQQLSSEAGNFPLIKKAGTNQSVSANYVLSDLSALAELKELTLDEKKNLFGIVRVHMKGKTNGLNVLTSNHKIRSPFQVFELNFKNRKTTWRYIFNKNQQVKNNDDVKKEAGNAQLLITKQVQPLTSNGFVSIELGGVELPNPTANMVKPGTTNNKIYSEIYM